MKKMFRDPASNDTLVQNLRHMVRDDVRTEHFRLSLREQILSQAEVQRAGMNVGAAHPSPGAHPRRRPSIGRWQGRTVSLGTVAALVLGGFVGYLRLQAPTPVSAAQVLHRAAAALTAPDTNHVVHEVATIHATAVDGLRVHLDGSGLAEPNGQLVRDATVDEWTQLSPNGDVSRQDVTVTDIPTGTLLIHQVVTGQDLYRYDYAFNGTTIMPGGAAIWRHVMSSGQPVTVLDLESGGQGGLLQLLAEAQRGGAARFAGQQTVDGASVDVIQITQRWHVAVSPGSDVDVRMIPDRIVFRLYIDTQSYLLHHVSAEAVSPQGETLSTATLQITQHDVLPVGSAPVNAFTFSSPPGACVMTEYVNQPSRFSQSKPCSGFVRP